MRELSIFVDESGSDGLSDRHYLLTVVMHDQSENIANSIAAYEGARGLDAVILEGVDGHGERRVYFVTETKGGKNGEPALRDAEKIKIGCAKKHFEALELGDDFHYNVRTTYQYEAVKA